MEIKALKNFSGLVTMTAGEARNVRDEIARDLISAGYAEAVKPAPVKPPKTEKEDKE